MSDFFYNTINLSGERLKDAIAKSMYQEELIHEIYKANPNKLISPSQILYVVKRKYYLHWPITSCRRAITNLSGDIKGRVLTKTSVMIDGAYGKPEHQWMLTDGNSESLKKIAYVKGTTTAADFASMIINSSKPKFVQPKLFEDKLENHK